MENYIVKDIDYDFEAHPVTGDILLKTDISAINQSIKTIILSDIFEKPFRTDFSVAVNQFLFENDDGSAMNYLVDRIYKKLSKFEPRATNLFVKISNKNDNGISIDISYTLNNKSNEAFTVNIERNR